MGDSLVARVYKQSRVHYFQSMADTESAKRKSVRASACSPSGAKRRRKVSDVDKPKTTRVAVIGTAGRTGPPMSAALFDSMVQHASDVITTRLGLDKAAVHLVSGGAAWSDHIAVRLFNSGDFAGLTLILPCEWESGRHKDSGHRDWRINPGQSANRYHRAFSRLLGRDTLRELDDLITGDERVVVVTGKGFHQRNTQIANTADVVLAFTWANGAEPPAKGGTRDTWNKARLIGTKCIHVSLNSLVTCFDTHE